MRSNLGRLRCFVGIDVSQDRLDVCLLPAGERAEFSRDRRGIARLAAWLISQERLLVVVEATGGLERTLTGALAQAGIAVAVVNPRQTRDFARAPGSQGRPRWSPRSGAAGLLAKTDRLDAYALALYGERLRPVSRPPRSAADQALAALVLRRRQLAQLAEESATEPGAVKIPRSWPRSRPISAGCRRRSRSSKVRSTPVSRAIPCGGIAPLSWRACRELARSRSLPCSLFCPSSDSSTAEPSPRGAPRRPPRSPLGASHASGSPPSPATAA